MTHSSRRSKNRCHLSYTLDIANVRTRYLLQQFPLSRSPAINQPLTEAGVLIALIEYQNKPQLILTKRPAHLRDHPNQISLPGGKFERADANIIHTALREASEEIALPSHKVEILGTLPKYNTFTGFAITPVLGLMTQSFTPTLAKDEVAECFTIPLDYLLDNKNYQQYSFYKDDKYHSFYFIRYQHRLIWGATAGILHQLCQQLK